MTDPDDTQAMAAVAAIDAVPLILEVICRVTGMGFAGIARVTEDRWVACAVHDEAGFGLVPGSELPIDTTFCQRIRQTGEPVSFAHASTDPLYRDDPIPRLYRLESYISFPITLADGRFFGTICALDTRPIGAVTPEMIGLFRLMSDLVAFHLDAHTRIAEADDRLREEQMTAILREEFVAVLSHDLRNPLASIAAGVRMLRRYGIDPKAAEVLELMEASVARMSRLIADTTDFARVRLGGGFEMRTGAPQPIGPAIAARAEELRLAHPGRRIDLTLEEAVVVFDPARLGQMVSNLIGNALTHGAPGCAVTVTGGAEGGDYVIRVANPGEPIPADLMPHLFKPFVHAGRGRRDGGLGLGLFIADQIARAHGGALSAASDAQGTVMTLRLPLAA